MDCVTDADGDSDPRSLCDGTTDQWLRCAAVLQKLPNLPGIGTETSSPYSSSTSARRLRNRSSPVRSDWALHLSGVGSPLLWPGPAGITTLGEYPRALALSRIDFKHRQHGPIQVSRNPLENHELSDASRARASGVCFTLLIGGPPTCMRRPRAPPGRVRLTPGPARPRGTPTAATGLPSGRAPRPPRR